MSSYLWFLHRDQRNFVFLFHVMYSTTIPVLGLAGSTITSCMTTVKPGMCSFTFVLEYCLQDEIKLLTTTTRPGDMQM